MPAKITGRDRPVSRFSALRPTLDSVKLGLFAILIGATFLWGGSARIDVPALLFLRPLTIFCLGVFLLTPGPSEKSFLTGTLALLLAFAATMAIQLIPLPADIWAALPGRQQYMLAPFFSSSSWRPISLAPDLTWNSLVALVTPLTALVGFGALSDRHRQVVAPLMLLIGAASILLGFFQIVGGQDLAYYFSKDVDFGLPIGFFANRNHQAVMLATLIPLLRVWSLQQSPAPGAHRNRVIFAVAASTLVLATILLTGSRSGLLMAVVGVATAVAISPGGLGRRHKKTRWLWLSGAITTLTVVVAAFGISGRADTFVRLAGFVPKNEQRIEYLPKMIEIAGVFAPFGSGYGSFDPIFRNYEPTNFLNLYYFNHAHNELIELAMTGGVLPLLVLAAALFLWGRQSISMWRRSEDNAVRLGRAGAGILLILLLASLTDYPLRTPALALYFAICSAWLARGAARPAGASPV